MDPFQNRPINPLGLLQQRGWDIKCYSIVYGDHGFDRDRFSGGVDLAMAALPTPARTAKRPGVAILIAHQGNGADYVVLAWWDRENELPLRVFVRDQSSGPEWRPAQGSESVCVWDLDVLWAEREAYVNTVLAGGEPEEARDVYISRTLAR